jgi:chromate transport protein ChrA
MVIDISSQLDKLRGTVLVIFQCSANYSLLSFSLPSLILIFFFFFLTLFRHNDEAHSVFHVLSLSVCVCVCECVSNMFL